MNNIITREVSMGGEANAVKTEIYIGRWKDTGVIYTSLDPKFDHAPAYALEHMATVSVYHPIVMCGSCEEVTERMTRAAVKQLMTEGLIVSTESGIEFWA